MNWMASETRKFPGRENRAVAPDQSPGFVPTNKKQTPVGVKEIPATLKVTCFNNHETLHNKRFFNKIRSSLNLEKQNIEE
jgi:hypothetical protein